MGQIDIKKNNDIINIINKRKKQVFHKENINKNLTKKSLPKLVIFVIIFTIIGLIASETLPWTHFKLQTEDSLTEESIYKNAQESKIKTIFLYEPPYSNNIGLTIKDFTNAPIFSLYGLICLLVIGITIFFYWFVNKKNNFNFISFSSVRLLFYLIIIIPCVFIILSSIRFLGTYLMLAHHFSNTDKAISDLSLINFPQWSFPVPLLLVILSLIIILFAISMLDLDLNKKIINEEKSIFRQLSFLRANKLMKLIMITSIFSLIFISFTPLIANQIPSDSSEFKNFATPGIKAYVKENHDEKITITINSNINSMKETNNVEIKELNKDLSIINYFLWIIIFLVVFLYIFLIYSIDKKSYLLSKKFILIGCLTVICSVFILYMQFSFIKNVGTIENISLASMYFKNFPIKYFYIPFILSITSTVLSTSFVTQGLLFLKKLKIENRKKELDKTFEENYEKDRYYIKKDIEFMQNKPLLTGIAPNVASAKSEDDFDEWLAKRREFQKIKKTFLPEVMKAKDDSENKEDLPYFKSEPQEEKQEEVIEPVEKEKNKIDVKPKIENKFEWDKELNQKKIQEDKFEKSISEKKTVEPLIIKKFEDKYEKNKKMEFSVNELDEYKKSIPKAGFKQPSNKEYENKENIKNNKIPSSDILEKALSAAIRNKLLEKTEQKKFKEHEKLEKKE